MKILRGLRIFTLPEWAEKVVEKLATPESKLSNTLSDAGVKNGDRLELWIRVTLRDLIEDKDIGQKIFLLLYGFYPSNLTENIRQARKRGFSSSEVARIAAQFFEHVDK